MEEEIDYREELKKSFHIAAYGAAACTVSGVISLIAFLSESADFDGGLIAWLSILGALVMGGGLVSAGRKLCDNGHKETGVTTAGGGFIFAGLIHAVILLFISEESLAIGAESYIWTGLDLLGFVIVYFALKQDGKKEDKFFDMAAWGVGIIIVVNIILFVLLKMLINADEADVRNPGFTVKLAIWFINHFKLVMTLYLSAVILGYLLTWLSFGNYSDFIDDLEEEKREDEKEKLIDEALAEYKKNHAGDAEKAADEDSDE